MNIYFYIIVVIILFEYLLSFIVRTLNLKALDPNLPKEFEDTFDNEKYLKSQEYTKSMLQPQMSSCDYFPLYRLNPSALLYIYIYIY